MKKIVIPVDFSVQAEYAVEVGAQIAKQTGASIKLLHTIDMVILQSDAPSQVTNVMEIAKALELGADTKMREWVKKSILEGITVTSEIKMANTFHSIMGEVDDNADLIVMGSKGASGLEEFMVGSNAEKVVRWSDVPVLVVKERVKDFSIKNVLFVSNFYEEIEHNFPRIERFLSPFKVKYHLLKVVTPTHFEPTSQSIEVIEEFAKKMNLEDYTVNTYNDITLEEGINHFCQAMNPDIVIMPTHARKGISHLFYGSKTENSVNHINAPILTFKIDHPEHNYKAVFPEMR